MESCVLCKKEDPILAITAKAYPIGAKCFGKLTNASVVWNEDTTLAQVRDGLRQVRREAAQG